MLVGFVVATLALALSLRALAATGVPVRAASDEAVSAALELLELREGERFVDLGCGEGKVLRAARRRARVSATGYELNPAVALWAGLRSLPDSAVHVRCRDARRADLGQAQALYAYLMPAAMAALAPKLEALAPGTRVASVDFPIPGWTPLRTREVGPLRQPVMLYVIGRHRG